jgi:hypothetical protein
LVLLGFLMLGGLFLANATEAHGLAVLRPLSDMVHPADRNTIIMISGGAVSTTLHPEEYWSIGIAAVFLATVIWYARGKVRQVLLVAAYGLAALVLFYLTIAMVQGQQDLGPTLGGSFIAIGAAAGAWVYFRLGPGQLGVTAISVVCLTIGVSALLIGNVPLFAEHLIVICGLLALAVRERSALLAVVAAGFLAVTWMFPSGPTGLALAAVVLFLGGAAAVLTTRRGQWAGEHTE